MLRQFRFSLGYGMEALPSIHLDYMLVLAGFSCVGMT